MISKIETTSSSGLDKKDSSSIDLDAFISYFGNYLPDCPQKQYVMLAKAMLHGVFQLKVSNKDNKEKPCKLFVTPPSDELLQEPNLLLRLTDNLLMFLNLGHSILGSEKIKVIIQTLFDLVENQPLVKSLKEAGADYIEFWLMLSFINAHFEGEDFCSIYKAGKATLMPKSYLVRLTNRIHDGQCVLLNAGFVDETSYVTLYYVFYLKPKTLALIGNPIWYKESPVE